MEREVKLTLGYLAVIDRPFSQLINFLNTSETESEKERERQETLWERQWGPSVGKMIAEESARHSEAERNSK